MTTLQEVRETFAFIDDWSERYRYLMELGATLPALTDDERIDANKVRGCLSQVWIVPESSVEGSLRFRADSDAHIVKGLVALVLLVFNDKSKHDIVATDIRPILAELGLDKHLSPGRSNGLFSMVKRIQDLAGR